MKRLPLCALVLSLLCAVAGATQSFPTWKVSEEPADRWTLIKFKDDKQAEHQVYCRIKDCLPAGKSAAGQLFVLKEISRAPYQVPDGIMPWDSAHTAFSITYTATLSHYSLVDGKIERDDHKVSPAFDAKTQAQSFAPPGSKVVVSPPTAMADDGGPAEPVVTTPGGPTAPPKPPRKPGEEDVDAALNVVLADCSPIERAIIKQVASADERRKIAHGTINPHAFALDKARHDTDDPAKSPLRDFLKTQGFDEKAFAAYVGCDTLLPSPATADGAQPTLDVLKAMYTRLQMPSGPSPESIHSQADVFTAVRSLYPNLQKYCQDQVNAGKVDEQQRPGGPPQPSLTVTAPPAPGVVSAGSRNDAPPGAPPSGGASGGGDKKDGWDTLTKATLGGTVGFFGGLIVATVLGLGPLGLFGLAIFGLGAGAFLATNHMPKDGGKK